MKTYRVEALFGARVLTELVDAACPDAALKAVMHVLRNRSKQMGAGYIRAFHVIAA